ncbi:c-type cytochrome biogenesis protein CcmI [Maricaulis sp.]|uniref:c-type cytochrome biogenesis protein CcmI n=1 Tax=Maricaulis sp. TaxID=1486257 RepID=UPI0025BCFD32|nr:c-type cytochrome biogenesis protein CcmI [Maricaulis sp.]
MIWILIAFLASLVVLALVLPVMRGVRGSLADGTDVFVGQLAELDRDRELGFIETAAARQAELEIRRRMSQSAAVAGTDAASVSTVLRRGLVAGSGVSAILAVALYLILGSPHLVGMEPARAPELPEEAREIMAELANLRASLESNPDNPQGWAVLGEANLRIGRYTVAAEAFESAIDWEPGSAYLFASLGQARLFEAGGTMTPTAREAFARALDVDPLDVRARFFMAEAVYQDGDREAALASWQAILDESGADAAYRGMVEARIAAARAESALDGQPGDDGNQ